MRKDEHSFKNEWLEENLDDLYENAPCGYLSALPDGTIIKVNYTFLQWFGFSKEQLIGKKKFQKLLTIGGQIFYETHHLPLLTMQGFVEELSYEIITHDGQRWPILVNARQKKDESGNPLFTRITVFNFIDRKKYEQELMYQKKKAEAATKAKDAFLSTVTHEIRTPIHAIIGVSDLLRKKQPRPDQKELIEALQFSAENLLYLINDLLDLSKLNAGLGALSEKPFNLKKLAQNLMTSLDLVTRSKDLKLRLSFPPGMQEFYLGDELKIGRILSNLVGNAIKFTKEGEVHLNIDGKDQGKENMEITFSVSDTGIGIEKENLKNIFEAFKQANESIHLEFGGTGLGLSISQRLLALYDSQVEVESQPGKGSTFSFKLLLSPCEKIVEENAKMPKVESPLSGINLLLVEDNASNVLIATKYLQGWDVTFDTAGNGEEAVKLATKNAYHVVLMDLHMPTMDGFEATRRIRKIPGREHLPIFAFSASPLELMAPKLEAVGIDGLIAKPLHPEELYAILQSLHGHVFKKESECELDFTEVQKIFDGEYEAIKEFLEILASDLDAIKTEFSTAAVERNYQKFWDARHKTSSFIQLFQPASFENALQAIMHIFKNEDWGKLPAANENLIKELDKVILRLKKEITNLGSI